MSSNYDTYSRLHARSLYASETALRIHNDTDDSKTVTLKATPSEAGNVDITLPTTAGALLTSNDNVNANKLTGLDALGQPGLANEDVFLYADNSDSNAVVGVSGADLKTFINAGQTSLPSGSNDQFMYHNGADWTASNVGGDMTHTGGNFTVANGAIDNSKVAVGAGIEKSKLGPLNITNSDIQPGAGIEKSKLGNLDISNSDIAVGANISKSKLANLDIADSDVAGGANIAYNKLDLNNAIQSGDLTDNCVTEDKIANNQVKDNHIVSAGTAGVAGSLEFVKLDANKDIAGLNEVETVVTYIGGPNKWRMKLSGDDLVMEQYDPIGLTWNVGHTIASTI